MQIDLSGKVAVVTGASGELGRVITRTLADCGAVVAIHYHQGKDRGVSLLDELNAKGYRCMTVQADVADEKSVNVMRDSIAAELGRPDIIVNNAVSKYEWKHVLDQPVPDYESQFRTCVLHNVAMAKAFVPAMIEKQWGRVVAINTECAMLCGPNESAYASGKRGMDGVLRVLAREIGEHNITVNQVAPGWMISDRDRKSNTERCAEYDKRVPLGHRGEDQDVANLVAFLASDLAKFITGAYIPVCGGMVMPTI